MLSWSSSLLVSRFASKPRAESDALKPCASSDRDPYKTLIEYLPTSWFDYYCIVLCDAKYNSLSLLLFIYRKYSNDLSIKIALLVIFKYALHAFTLRRPPQPCQSCSSTLAMTAAAENQSVCKYSSTTTVLYICTHSVDVGRRFR